MTGQMNKKMIRMLAPLLCAAILAAVPAFAAVAPLNPAFTEYVVKHEGGAKNVGAVKNNINIKGTAGVPNFGYVPSPLDWSHLRGVVYPVGIPRGDSAARAARAADQLPATYDIRPSMPAVRNQNPFGNCWTYSAMAATESNLIKQGLASSSDIALSVWYITYYAYNSGSGFVPFTNVSGQPYYNAGGNDWRAVALLGRGTGSLYAAEAPAPLTAGAVYAPAVAPRRYKLNNAFYLGSDGNFEVPLSQDRREMIKGAVMEYGAASVGIYQFRDNGESQKIISKDVFSDEKLSYYTGLQYGDNDINGSTVTFGTNHAVTIVGWDDNYPKENFAAGNPPQEDGAWIIRNSWGADWGGDGGYFYVSYEEGTLCDGVVYDTAAARSGERVYQYDPLGPVTWYSLYDEGSTEPVQYFANLFTAAADDRISSIAFYVPEPGNSYEIKIYQNCGANSPVSGSLASTVSAVGLVPGYNTVKLKTPVDVASGTRFSVVVKAAIKEGSFSYPVPIEYREENYSEEASANPGEGWVSGDGVNFQDIIDAGGDGTVSICLKAFGERQHNPTDTVLEPSGPVTVDAPEGVMAAAEEVSAGDNTKVQQTVIAELKDESVEGIAADKNVTLKGVFALTVSHGNTGGAASFTVPFSTPLSFAGEPYVIIPKKDGSGFVAFPAKYSAGSLSFGVSDLNEFFSTAEITVADVRESAAPAPSGGGSGGGCAAGLGAAALLLLIPLALVRRGRRS